MFSREDFIDQKAGRKIGQKIALSSCLIALIFASSSQIYADEALQPAPAETSTESSRQIFGSIDLEPVDLEPVDLELFARGERLFSKCDNCHKLAPDEGDKEGKDGEKNAKGPNLYGIFGAKAGTNPNFEFSNAMKAANIVWDEQAMDAFIEKPKNLVPKTSMSLWGIRKAEDREALIYYLKQTTQ